MMSFITAILLYVLVYSPYTLAIIGVGTGGEGGLGGL